MAVMQAMDLVVATAPALSEAPQAASVTVLTAPFDAAQGRLEILRERPGTRDA